MGDVWGWGLTAVKRGLYRASRLGIHLLKEGLYRGRYKYYQAGRWEITHVGLPVGLMQTYMGSYRTVHKVFTGTVVVILALQAVLQFLVPTSHHKYWGQ